MEEAVNSIIQAVGLTCEVARLLRDQMEANGFSHEEATEVAGEYILRMLTTSRRSEDDAID